MKNFGKSINKPAKTVISGLITDELTIRKAFSQEEFTELFSSKARHNSMFVLRETIKDIGDDDVMLNFIFMNAHDLVEKNSGKIFNVLKVEMGETAAETKVVMENKSFDADSAMKFLLGKLEGFNGWIDFFGNENASGMICKTEDGKDTRYILKVA